MAERKSIRELTDTEKSDFISAVLALKAEFSAVDGLSTYNRYVLWHQLAMFQATPFGNDLPQTRRNFAHRGPGFLPWHREFLYRFERDLQRVSGSPDMALPYWNWEVDGEQAPADQPIQPIWSLIGGTGAEVPINPDFSIFVVEDGPFGIPVSELSNPDTFRPDNPLLTLTVTPQMVNGEVRVSMARSVLMRNLGAGTPTLPNIAEVNAALAIPAYDVSPWNEGSDLTQSFRNALEGWQPGWPNVAAGSVPGLHNRVHVWVGGSMGPGTSPNDPAFFLHHSNVDRIWAKWAPAGGNPAFVPMENGPYGHTAQDPMYPWDGRTLPESVTVLEGADPKDTVYIEPASG